MGFQLCQLRERTFKGSPSSVRPCYGKAAWMQSWICPQLDSTRRPQLLGQPVSDLPGQAHRPGEAQEANHVLHFLLGFSAELARLNLYRSAVVAAQTVIGCWGMANVLGAAWKYAAIMDWEIPLLSEMALEHYIQAQVIRACPSKVKYSFSKLDPCVPPQDFESSPSQKESAAAMPVGLELQHRVEKAIVHTSAGRPCHRYAQKHSKQPMLAKNQYLYPAKDVANAPSHHCRKHLRLATTKRRQALVSAVRALLMSLSLALSLFPKKHIPGSSPGMVA